MNRYGYNNGLGHLGPDIAPNMPYQKYMPQVTNPCDIRGPLAEGSNWPYEVLIYPAAARPAYGKTFNLYRELEVTVAGTFVDVVDIELGNTEEGRILEWAGVEEAAVGSDLFWRIVQNDSSPSRLDVMRGGWSTIDNPAKIIVPIPSNTKLALQVALPAASVTPRTVRGLIKGWTAPYDGGGTFAGGYAR